MISRFVGYLGIPWIVLISLGCLVGRASSMAAQPPRISHFVAPRYPPLARQATITGQVVLEATIGVNGKIAKVTVNSSTHPLLTQSATAAVKEWEYTHGRSETTVTIRMIFGLSGTIKPFIPETTVKCDFDNFSVRVFITTDAFPASDHAVIRE